MRLMTAALCLLVTIPASGDYPAAWTEPVDPFTIVGNVHYVGTADLASYLITTPDGHILIDAPMEENVPLLLSSIRTLGFDPGDVKVLLNTHAHFDHAGGFAALKRETGARLLASPADAELLERGGSGDFAFGDTATFPPVEVDGLIEDGQVVDLGGARLRAIATPGHTKGGTSWVMQIEDSGHELTVLFANSMSAPGYDLVDNPRYPEIMSDYRASFERLASIDADVFLPTHGSFIRLRDKIAAMHENPLSNPFVDPGAAKRYVERWSRIVEAQYDEQMATAAVDTLLDRFHLAASEADGERYFSYFAPDGIFIGTDAGERWNVDQFRSFAEPYFSRGQGWTYRPVSRNVYVNGQTAWFDEILENDSYGITRGTGVLVREGEEWRIAQYHLTIPIPNEVAEDVVNLIRELAASEPLAPAKE